MGAQGLLPAAGQLNPLQMLHLGTSAAILRLSDGPGRMNATAILGGIRAAVAVGDRARTVGVIVFKEAGKELAKLAGRLVEESAKSAAGGPKGEGPEDEDPRKTKIKQGKSQAPDLGEPDSIYEQLGDDGKVKSRTFFDENGRMFARQDFEGSKPHKIDGKPAIPHEHSRIFDAQGLPLTKEATKHLPSGYSNAPSL